MNIDYQDWRNKVKGIIIGLAVCLLITLLLESCANTKYIPAESLRTEYVYSADSVIEVLNRYRQTIDSLVSVTNRERRDCTIVVKDTSGAVKYIERWHSNEAITEIEKSTNQIDFVGCLQQIINETYKNITGSISKPYPVEKKLTKWQQLKVDWFGYLLLILAIALVIAIKYIINNKKKPTTRD